MTTSSDAERRTTWHFEEDLDVIPQPISLLLEKYSNVPKQDQKQHILDVRNHAYKRYPYPCLGRFRFLELDLSKHPLYTDYILSRLKEESDEHEPIFLDLGTCLGQDVRKLLFDGVPPSRLYGADIVPEFIDFGYELFRDGDSFPRSHFLCPADVFDKSENDELRKLDGKVDILCTTAVFHLFPNDQQLEVAERCLRLLRKEPGTRCLIVGGQVGNINGTEAVRPNGSKRARHNADNWRSLWEHARELDEFKDKVKELDVHTEMIERIPRPSDSAERLKQIGSLEEGFRWLVWQVWVQF